jgi:putrescine aminotransferase
MESGFEHSDPNAQSDVSPSQDSALSAEQVERITEEVGEKYSKYVNPKVLALLKMGNFDRIEWEGSGAIIRDLAGVEYIDCLGGYGVFSLGHAHPVVVEAVVAQLRRLPLSTKTFLNKPLADLAELLAKITPGDLQYSFISNSGAEAVEAALKFARMATGKHKIISTVGSYHGKTLGALSASGREMYKTPFAPLLPGFVQVPFDDIDALAAAIDDDTAAVILEPIQGENGIRIPSDDYLPAARRLCDESGALLILDEVQTGLGRTGTMFACERVGVTPDLMTLAKALGGGVFPIGATVATPAVWDRVFTDNPFIHSSTFGGNEAACVAALTTIGILLDEDLSAQSEAKGAKLLAGLKTVQAKYPDLLEEARGRGLMIGVEFKDADIGKLAIGALVHNGVVAAYTLNNAKVMRFEPPLVITDAQVETVIAAFDAAMGEVEELLAEFA